ncbi:HlyD family type I secretion periplasmic adaptor subunit [Motiliproteus sp.]|uniref:HlyD family type I secretion periplasmic adaptor subunit n=1 Tax=Motiliproteus sp. TaxID=1898955 RepID=UPI003BAB382B
MNPIRALINAWQQRGSLGDKHIAQDELEFLPAALEIQDRPPSPMGRVMMWTLIGLFLIGVAWACVGKVDIVAVAEGKIVPSGKIKPIQPLEKGVVSRILVKEGEAVIQGQPLVELDATQTEADQQRLQHELLTTQLNLARQQALANRLASTDTEADTNDQLITWPQQASEAQRQLHQSLFDQQWAQYQAQTQALRRTQAAKLADKDASQARIRRLEATLPLISERADALKQLSERKMAARNQYLELESERVDNELELVEEQARQRQLRAALQETEAQLQVLRSQSRAQAFEALAESQRQQRTLVEDLSKARDRNQRQILYAPVDGVIKELVLASPGEVVTPAQPLMQIVPREEALVVEAYLANKDIGFIREQMDAAIKVHTFPFTKYGLIEAEVIQVSADALADEEKGLIYKMKLLMDQDWLNVEGNKVQLIPGMAVTAEVKTGTRRLIEYFLAPLLRYRQESVRER